MTAPPTTPDDLDAWRSLPIAQQPDWPDDGQVAAATAELAKQPPLVFAGECDQLKERLGAVAQGDAFLLQGGDCAETFAGSTADAVRNKLKTLLQMAVVLTYAASVPVVKVGRMAGQFAKPRSRPPSRATEPSCPPTAARPSTASTSRRRRADRTRRGCSTHTTARRSP